MSRQITLPSNQIKLTNVSLVRLKKGKKRFEIACYKNKVLEWRSGIETDLDNVLQIPNVVFLNVSKGQTAPAAELSKAFGRDATPETVVLEILRKGELQVGDKERAAQLERVHHEVVDLVAGKLVDPRTRRVYTTGMIEKALDMLSAQAHQQQEKEKEKEKEKEGKDQAEGEADKEAPAAKAPLWTGVTTTKSAKSQALEAMKALVALQPIPVMRARMRMRVSCATSVLKQAVKAAPAASASSAHGHGHKSGGKHAGKKGASSEASSAPATSAGDGGDDGDADSHRKTPGTVKDRILSYIEQVDSQDVVGSTWEVVGFVEPGAFKALSDFVGNETRGQGRVEVLDVAVTHDD